MANVIDDLTFLRTALTIEAFCEGEARQQMTESALTPKSINRDISVMSCSIWESVIPSTTTTQCATRLLSSSIMAAAILPATSPSSDRRITTVE
ncbi:hypothetical protein AWJ20_4311 [Sugiyamaella lignohabitans]|uniref:Uncharacterized protein n=1 Tax=Sugiyamaella lignohabitans TaxID=796027 RepID=A0A167CC99_9ASCO|nr:uncharacterized protein AWJ20_4311 [Sugiyamaella lignohabitans]ANB11496.1 hypothetical protein AWJ20_4311 [Sugiyamaella lignohabitans]